jgi:hypothetical protein
LLKAQAKLKQSSSKAQALKINDENHLHEHAHKQKSALTKSIATWARLGLGLELSWAFNKHTPDTAQWLLVNERFREWCNSRASVIP